MISLDNLSYTAIFSWWTRKCHGGNMNHFCFKFKKKPHQFIFCYNDSFIVLSYSFIMQHNICLIFRLNYLNFLFQIWMDTACFFQTTLIHRHLSGLNCFVLSNRCTYQIYFKMYIHIGMEIIAGIPITGVPLASIEH